MLIRRTIIPYLKTGTAEDETVLSASKLGSSVSDKYTELIGAATGTSEGIHLKGRERERQRERDRERRTKTERE